MLPTKERSMEPDIRDAFADLGLLVEFLGSCFLIFLPGIFFLVWQSSRRR